MYRKIGFVLSLFTTIIFINFFHVSAVSVNKFYPFGVEYGDVALPKNARETVSPEIPLRTAMKFYGSEYNSLYVSTT